MACMRWEITTANFQHQCLPWTAASAICSHRQLHKLVQPAYIPAHHSACHSSTHRSLPCSSSVLHSAVQQLQSPIHTCRLASSGLRSKSTGSSSISSFVCHSTVLSSNRETQTTLPGSGWPPSSSPGGGDSGDDPYNANFGEAVLVLREDLPLVFQQEMRYHIFREDITFRTPSMAYLTGLWKYQLLHKGARLLGNLLYADVKVSLARIWQPAMDKKQLKVHWCVSGHPRLSLSVKDLPLSTEVISTYFFDSKGKIYEHQVDQIIPPESLPVKFLEWLVGRLQPRAIPQPQLPIPGA